jgi:NitT/TauT family transport system substrate-binding protein
MPHFFRFRLSRLRLAVLPAFALLGLLAGLAGCTRHEPLRIGLNIWPGYEFIYLAQHLGYYKQEGVDVKIIDFSSLGEARRSFERGQIDGRGTTSVEVMLAGEASADPLKIVNVVDYSDGADVIITRPGFPDLASLKGRKVGVELGSICVYVLARGLEQNGMTLADVVPVSKDQASMEADLRAGLLDAVVTYPPTSMAILKDPAFQTVFSTKKTPREVIDVIAFGDKAITQRPKDVAAMLRAHNRAQDYYVTHKAEALQIMAKREGVSTEEFEQALTDGMRIVTAADQAAYLREGGIKTVIARTGQVLTQTKLLHQPKAAESYFSDRFVTAAP